MTGDEDIGSAVLALEGFSSPAGLTRRISDLEDRLRGRSAATITKFLEEDGVKESSLVGALVVKALAGQVNVIVHTLGILLALPAILEDGEVIDNLSLGAGNTGRSFDLETNLRIAEFKFIAWKGGPEAIRQNGLFVDLYHLAESDTDKRRQLYVTEIDRPLRFLRGRRSINSVLTKHGTVADEFNARYGDRYRVVHEYWSDVQGRIELVDVSHIVPAFGRMPNETTNES